MRGIDQGWLQETHEQLSYGHINTNYHQTTMRVCLLWQRRAVGTVAAELALALRIDNYARAKFIIRQTIRCVIGAMGTLVTHDRRGILITDCNCRNILWNKAGKVEEARIGDWGCGHVFQGRKARDSLHKLLIDLDDRVRDLANKKPLSRMVLTEM
eukprot:12930029-Prorocentrum_lima.AAC.1